MARPYNRKFASWEKKGVQAVGVVLVLASAAIAFTSHNNESQKASAPSAAPNPDQALPSALAEAMHNTPCLKNGALDHLRHGQPSDLTETTRDDGVTVGIAQPAARDSKAVWLALVNGQVVAANPDSQTTVNDSPYHCQLALLTVGPNVS